MNLTQEVVKTITERSEELLQFRQIIDFSAKKIKSFNFSNNEKTLNSIETRE
jgi:hypothetical protein